MGRGFQGLGQRSPSFGLNLHQLRLVVLPTWGWSGLGLAGRGRQSPPSAALLDGLGEKHVAQQTMVSGKVGNRDISHPNFIDAHCALRWHLGSSIIKAALN